MIYKTSALMIAALTLVISCSESLAQSNRFLPVDGERAGIKGVNLPWFDGAYGHDFGRSTEGWKPAYTRAKAEAYFSDIARMDAKVVKFFVFAGGSGIMTDSEGYFTGIDPEFMRNLKEAISIADKHGLDCYLIVLGSIHELTWKTGGKSIITNSKARSNFFKHVAIPLTRELKGNPGVFAFDLATEPESSVYEDGGWAKKERRGYTWKEMRAFLKAYASVVHRTDRSRLVSVGASGEYTLPKGYYLGLGLDFFDFHVYRDDGQLIHVNKIRNGWAKRRIASRKELNLPILVGEFGQGNGPDARSDDELQRRVTANFLKNARDKGYAGALIWSYEWPGVPSKDKMAWDRLVKGDGDSSWRPAAYEIKNFKW